MVGAPVTPRSPPSPRRRGAPFGRHARSGRAVRVRRGRGRPYARAALGQDRGFAYRCRSARGRGSSVRDRPPRYLPASTAGRRLHGHAPTTLAVEAPVAGEPQLERIAQANVVDAAPTLERAKHRQRPVGGRLAVRAGDTVEPVLQVLRGDGLEPTLQPIRTGSTEAFVARASRCCQCGWDWPPCRPRRLARGPPGTSARPSPHSRQLSRSECRSGTQRRAARLEAARTAGHSPVLGGPTTRELTERSKTIVPDGAQIAR